MSEKTPRIRPHETQWGHSQGLTMPDLRAIGDRMYHPLNPDQQRKIGQMSLTDGLPVIRDNVYPLIDEGVSEL